MASDEQGRRLISNSEIDTFRDCPRRWWLTYFRQLRRIRQDVVGTAYAGTVIHLFLALWYSGETGFDLEKQRAEQRRLINEALEEVGNDDPVRQADVGAAYQLADKVVTRYLDEVEESGVDAGLTFHQVEQELRLPLTERTVLRGKLDELVIREEDGHALVVDHKSVTQFGDAGWAHMRSQFLSYVLLSLAGIAALPGLHVVGVMLNMLKRVANPRTEANQRVEVPVNSAQVENHRRHLVSTVSAIEFASDCLDAGGPDAHHDIVPPHPSRDCGWKCPFVHVCPMFDRGEDAEYVLETEFEVGDPDERYGDADG